MSRVLDDEAMEKISKLHDLIVPWYLISCYAYYHLGTAILSDAFFDALALQLHESYDSLDHPHKHLIDRDSILVSGAFLKYPTIAKFSAQGRVKDVLGKEEFNARFQHDQ